MNEVSDERTEMSLFPAITDEWDVDKMEFRNNETELYVHYISSDDNFEKEITVPLSEFR